jgi:hypothetical protein
MSYQALIEDITVHTVFNGSSPSDMTSSAGVFGNDLCGVRAVGDSIIISDEKPRPDGLPEDPRRLITIAEMWLTRSHFLRSQSFMV